MLSGLAHLGSQHGGGDAPTRRDRGQAQADLWEEETEQREQHGGGQ
ncbi:MAG: hypothetical protein U0Z44_20615 [Kouleothrix sp.]